MRILIFSHGFYPAIGGIETTSAILAEGFAERFGAEVTVVTRTSDDNGDDKQFPFRVIRQPSPLKLLKEVSRTDVIFHNNPVMRFYWAQCIVRKPWAVVFRSYLWGPGYTYTIFEKFKLRIKYYFIRKADIQIANSKSTASFIPDTPRIIYNCYREDIFKTLNPGQRKTGSLVYLGRISEDKGVGVLLRALNILKLRGVEFNLSIVGDGEQRSDFESLCRKLEIESNVKFLGKKFGQDIVDELNKNSIIVVPSLLPETFGTVALEGAACGCVTVVSDLGGLPEAAGETGLKFEAGNSQDLANKIETLILNKNVYDSYKSNLESHVKQFSKDAFVENYYNILEGIVKR